MELCGIGHYVMRGRVTIVPEADFDQWLADKPSFADTQTAAAREAAAGQAHYATCGACHGANGEGNPLMNAPRIAGLDKHYLARQIDNFRSGKRGANPDDSFGQQMAAMAYIASLPHQPADADPALAGDPRRGAGIYQNCAVCHGNQGQGIWNMGAPRLAGMDPGYMATQLKHFREGIRGTHRDDQHGQQMVAMASILGGDQAIDDVIAYIATLQ